MVRIDDYCSLLTKQVHFYLLNILRFEINNVFIVKYDVITAVTMKNALLGCDTAWFL
jgi:hypothetical protein